MRCVCGNETNNKDGICAVCNLYNDHPEINEISKRDNPSHPPLKLRGGKGRVTGGERMATPKVRECQHEGGCSKYACKDGLCKRHYNEAHGIVKKRGRRPKEIASPSARKDKSKKTTLAKSQDNIDKSVIASGAKQSHVDILVRLHQEREQIDNAIKVIERYAR